MLLSTVVLLIGSFECFTDTRNASHKNRQLRVRSASWRSHHSCGQEHRCSSVLLPWQDFAVWMGQESHRVEHLLQVSNVKYFLRGAGPRCLQSALNMDRLFLHTPSKKKLRMNIFWERTLV
jgi:hypothetical protein